MHNRAYIYSCPTYVELACIVVHACCGCPDDPEGRVRYEGLDRRRHDRLRLRVRHLPEAHPDRPLDREWAVSRKARPAHVSSERPRLAVLVDPVRQSSTQKQIRRVSSIFRASSQHQAERHMELNPCIRQVHCHTGSHRGAPAARGPGRAGHVRPRPERRNLSGDLPELAAKPRSRPCGGSRRTVGEEQGGGMPVGRSVGG